MNTELLKQVAERIVERPQLFDMYTFYGSGGPKDLSSGDAREQCGTTACIAGEVCLLNNTATLDHDGFVHAKKREEFRGWEDEAVTALGITPLQGKKLFYVEHWPKEFRKRYHACTDKEDFAGAACVAAERIKHFVQTGE